jgi:topoisomerase-4 subunit A
MAKSTILAPPPPPYEPIKLKDALEERYLAYALSTIMGRALPDVRDGLKPVHRRILHAMRELKLDPDGAYKKCARVVGDVIGKFHPHGDQAVYDALVRLAQDFAQRYPLVDGQGNFGNIDGDNAAAYRYTEARLSHTATALLEGIDEETVDFRASFNGEDTEPVVLPANFPNLLANGAAGIAVGMATSIPPHNAEELCNALLHLIKHPSATIEKLVEFVPGPDFPTGGQANPRAEEIQPGTSPAVRWDENQSCCQSIVFQYDAARNGLRSAVRRSLPAHAQRSGRPRDRDHPHERPGGVRW